MRCMNQREGVVQGGMREYSEMYESKRGSSTGEYVGVQ